MNRGAVVDASAMSEVLVDGTGRGPAAADLLGQFDGCMAPHHLDLECMNAWRRMIRRGELTSAQAHWALGELEAAPIDRHATLPFLARIEQLSENLTPYDAAYVVLAESMGVPLITADVRLARASGPRCEFVVV